MKNISLIVCCSKNRGIGYNNHLLYHLKSDMEFFRKTTLNHYVIMGSKTFQSLNYIPLKDRWNIVLSSSLKGFPNQQKYDNILLYSSLKDISKILESDEEKFIIGGEAIYNQFIHFANKIYFTQVNEEREADRFFPKFDKRKYTYYLISSHQEDNLSYTIGLYERNKLL